MSKSDPNQYLRFDSIADIDPDSLPFGTPGNYSFRYIDISSVFGGRLITPEDMIMYKDAPSRARRKIQNGDVLMSTVRPNLKAFAYCDLPNENFVASTGFAVLRPKFQSDGRYILQCLLSDPVLRQIDSLTVGSNYPAINNLDVKRLLIPKFESRIRRKIGEILGITDKAIEKTEALIHKYQQIKAGLMHDLFTRGLTADGKLRPSREQALELYQETPIGWIPKEWGYESISLIMESLVDGPFGSNLKTEHYVIDPGVRVIRLQNIQAINYNDTDKAYISGKHANYLMRNKVVPGDILIAGLGEDRYPVGRACQYPKDLPPAINKADCFRLRCNTAETDNYFVMLYLNTPNARAQIRRYEQGVTRPRINLGNMKKIVIPKPLLKEQKVISKRLFEVALRIEKELLMKDKYKKQKSGLMHDLLTGKVPVIIAPEKTAHDS